MSEFPRESFEALGYYVYRLIDPQNHKTFYVGKGKGNRVFDHVKGVLKFEENRDLETIEEDEISAKMQTIHDILQDHKEVIHV